MKVVVIGTGGTIAEGYRKGEISILSAEELIQSVPSLKSLKDTTIIPVDFVRVPSSAINFDTLIKLTSTVEHAIQEYMPDGVVITMGTDTLEENAYFLNLSINTELPLVMVGAMRGLVTWSSDTELNMHNAVVAASSPGLKGMGLVVAMNGEIHSAKYVTKVNTTNYGAFQSPGHGPIGIIHRNKVEIFAKPIPEEKIIPGTVQPRVELIRCCVGMDGSLFEAIGKLDVAGLVIQGFGGGNLNPTMVPAIKKLLHAGVVVVLTTKIITGPLMDPGVEFDGSPGSLSKLGVILASGLSGEKARVKLFLALSRGMKKEEIRKLFEV